MLYPCAASTLRSSFSWSSVNCCLYWGSCLGRRMLNCCSRFSSSSTSNFTCSHMTVTWSHDISHDISHGQMTVTLSQYIAHGHISSHMVTEHLTWSHNISHGHMTSYNVMVTLHLTWSHNISHGHMTSYNVMVT